MHVGPAYDGSQKTRQTTAPAPNPSEAMQGVVLEVSFRFRHGCDVNKLSQKYPEVTMTHWCNFTVEVLEIHTRDRALAEEMRKELARLSTKGVKVLSQNVEGAGSQMLMLECKHKRGNTIDDMIEAHGCLYMPPVLYRGGWENYRMIAFDEGTLRKLFKTLESKGEVELVTKRSLKESSLTRSFVLSTDQLLGDLTPKQASALLAAVEHGYYRVPRKVRTEDIAKRKKVPRTTFEEHVRKAEAKVITSVAPYVAMYATGEAEAKS